MKAQAVDLTTWSQDRGDYLQMRVANTAEVSQWTRIGFIGEPIILHGKYHPDQGWLPFMQGTVLQHPPEDYSDADKPQRRVSRAEVMKLAARDIRVPHGCEKMFNYSDWRQYTLPYAEYQFVTGGELDKAMRTWDRQGPDEPVRRGVVRPPNVHSVSNSIVKSMSKDEFVAWGREHLRGRFGFSMGKIVFQFEVDALMAKLRFQGEHVEKAA